MMPLTSVISMIFYIIVSIRFYKYLLDMIIYVLCDELNRLAESNLSLLADLKVTSSWLQTSEPVRSRGK